MRSASRLNTTLRCAVKSHSTIQHMLVPQHSRCTHYSRAAHAQAHARLQAPARIAVHMVLQRLVLQCAGYCGLQHGYGVQSCQEVARQPVQ